MRKLNPDYVIGFIDGEGCFSVSITKHKTLKRRLEVRTKFEMELRADDHEILRRIQSTLACGKLYHVDYERYGWHPHSKYQISNIKELSEILIPFIDKHPLQAKKKEVYKLFKKVVLMMKNKEHLVDRGFREIQKIQNKIRRFSKKHHRNR